MRIGVDVGGTNTDAALMDGRTVVDAVKSVTTEDPGLGIIEAISKILDKTKILPNQLEAIMIGTTQFTNAFVENKRLEKVAVVRLGHPATISVPPFVRSFAASINPNINSVNSLLTNILIAWNVFVAGFFLYLL